MKIKDRAKPKLPPVEPGVYIGICVGVIDLGGGTSTWRRGPDYNADFNQDFRAALPEE